MHRRIWFLFCNPYLRPNSTHDIIILSQLPTITIPARTSKTPHPNLINTRRLRNTQLLLNFIRALAENPSIPPVGSPWRSIPLLIQDGKSGTAPPISLLLFFFLGGMSKKMLIKLVGKCVERLRKCGSKHAGFRYVNFWKVGFGMKLVLDEMLRVE